METILRSKEMAEIKLLPVRHHSPACAWHVKRFLENWKPDVVLIEGPDNANDRIPVMVSEETKAPFAVYYSYDDASGQLSPEKEKYKCYYPFLDYSPELEALRTATKEGIPVAFIDMPYGDILAASKEGKGLLKEAEKSTYNDDYLLSRSAYVKELCEKTGMRSFDEFWEKYFEIDGLYQEDEEWFGNLLVHCSLSRESTPKEELLEDGCLQREAYMAQRILEFLEKISDGNVHEKKKLLVITGGFHTPGLAQRLSPDIKRSNGNPEETQTLKLKKVPVKDQAVYLMPYSMEGADALNGYASGMPFAGFYQSVWERLTDEEVGATAVYEETILEYLLRCGKAVRSKEGGISTYDEICGVSMAKGLATLRGKKQPGVYELTDAVLSCFVKGEYTIATDYPMHTLRRLLIGDSIGALCKDANEPPILQDFRELCKDFGLKITSTLGEEVTLSVFAKKKHRQMSMLFHRLDFLSTSFARRLKGPNLQSGRDRNLMREIWKYKWSVQVMAALIDASVYGATIEEAVQGMIKQELKRELQAKDGALLLTKVFEMGLETQMESVYEKVKEILRVDTDFYSLAQALRLLTMLQELNDLYQNHMDLQTVTGICCRKLIQLLPAMSSVKEENMAPCLEVLKTLYQVTGKRTLQDSLDLREDYLQALQQMNTDHEIQAGIHGCVQGILYGSNRVDMENIEKVCRGYLSGTREQMMKTALFFRGLFFAAKDLVFVGNEFLEMLDTLLKRLDTEDFMKLLPELRIAFSYFTPGEVDRIAATVAGKHGKDQKDILYKPSVSEKVICYGKALDLYIEETLAGKRGYGLQREE